MATAGVSMAATLCRQRRVAPLTAYGNNGVKASEKNRSIMRGLAAQNIGVSSAWRASQQ